MRDMDLPKALDWIVRAMISKTRILRSRSFMVRTRRIIGIGGKALIGLMLAFGRDLKSRKLIL